MPSTAFPANDQPDDAQLMPSSEQPPPRSRRRRRALVAILALVPMLAVGGVAVAHAHKTIELDVDGAQQSVTTFAGSVQGLLDEQDVTLAEHDVAAPQPEEALRDGTLVVVRTAQQVELDVNAEPQQMWTTAQTTGDALRTVGEAGREVTVAASRSLDGSRQALDLPLVNGAPVDVVVDGETIRVTPDGEADVEDVLALAGVTLGKLDDVVVGTGDDDVVQLQVTRVQHTMRTYTEAIPFDTTERQDDSMFVGETRVVDEGAEGRQVRARLAVAAGEDETVGDSTGYVTVREPVARVIAVGTKERPVERPSTPAPTPTPSASSSPSPSSSSSSSSGSSSKSSSSPASSSSPSSSSSGSAGNSSSGSSSSSSGSESSGSSSSGGSESSGSSSSGGSESSGGSVSGGVWASLAQCESGGDPTIVSSNGLYHGLYQFSVGTWQSVGGSGLPSQASPAEQTRRAQILQQRSGWGQWPACSASLGLR